MLTPDSSRTLRITGWCLVVMGAVTLPIKLFAERDAFAALFSAGLVGFGWWMVGRSRA